MKRVTTAGTFRLKHKLLSIAKALKQTYIGLEKTGDGIWSIYFGTVLLGRTREKCGFAGELCTDLQGTRR